MFQFEHRRKKADEHNFQLFLAFFSVVIFDLSVPVSDFPSVLGAAAARRRQIDGTRHKLVRKNMKSLGKVQEKSVLHNI
jgi:hypothetical protein